VFPLDAFIQHGRPSATNGDAVETGDADRVDVSKNVLDTHYDQ
jgi:hypothetical protein